MTKSNPRDIPNRAHYDQCITWATRVFGRFEPEHLADLQRYVGEHAAAAAHANVSDSEKIRAVLAEIGFCAVIDHMASIIEDAGGGE